MAANCVVEFKSTFYKRLGRPTGQSPRHPAEIKSLLWHLSSHGYSLQTLPQKKSWTGNRKKV